MYLTLVELEIKDDPEASVPDEIRRYSYTSVPSIEGMYEPKVLSIGSITREIPLLPGEMSISDGSVRFADTDQEFRKLRATHPLRNRIIRIRFGDTLGGIDAFGTFMTGRITDTFCEPDGSFMINFRDASFDRLRMPVDGLLGLVDFPNMPPEQELVLAPVIYGEISSVDGSEKGAVPCYLTTQSNPYRYLVAQHACKSILNVYRYGVLLAPASWAKTESVINGRIYTFVDFSTDQRDSDRPNEIEITADVRGITDNDVAGGNLITNPVEALKHFLTHYCSIASGDLSSGDFTAAADKAADAGYIVGAWIGGTDATRAGAINTLALSFMMPFFVGRDGKYSVAILIADDLHNPPAGLAEITDNNDVVRGSFRVTPNPDLASALQYSYLRRWWEDSEIYERIPEQFSEDEADNLGQRILRDEKYPFCRDTETAHRVSASRLLFLRESLQFAEFAVPAIYLDELDLDLASPIKITHYLGPAADGKGYQDEVFEIIRLDMDFMPRSMRTAVFAVRIPDDPEYGDSHADQHVDVSHTDQAHTDVAHSDTAHTDSHADQAYSDTHLDWHSDSPHQDTPHSDGAHGDSHTDTHGDVAHEDTPYSDSHTDSHTDTHSDVAHEDVPYGDSHTDSHTDTHGDVAHEDSHTDQAHQDHLDDEYTDVPYSDSHTDSHTDTHSDTHGDIAHVDTPYYDQPHQDTHADGHSDVPHVDTPYYDQPHQDTHADGHVDQAHGDVSHSDHTDSDHEDQHTDNPHQDSHSDGHGDSLHQDLPYVDQQHGDTVHDDFHMDSDNPHLDHTDGTHEDHSDICQ